MNEDLLWAIRSSQTQAFANYASPESLLKAMRRFIKSLGDKPTVFAMSTFSAEAGWCGFVSYEP